MKASANKRFVLAVFWQNPSELRHFDRMTQLIGFPASTYVYEVIKKNLNKKYYFFVEKFHFENSTWKNPLVKFQFLW